MKFSSIAGMLLAIWSGTGACSDARYVIPASKAKGADGYPLYVDDAAIKAIVPGFADVGSRRTTCANSMVIPPGLWITFDPQVSGPHMAVLHSLGCTFEDRNSMRDLRGDLRCEAHVDDTIGFGKDPHRFFSLWGAGDRAKALELFQAFLSGRVQFSEDSSKPELDKISDVRMEQKSSDEFTIMWGDCGCTSSVQAQSDGNGRWRAVDRGRTCI